MRQCLRIHSQRVEYQNTLRGTLNNLISSNLKKGLGHCSKIDPLCKHTVFKDIFDVKMLIKWKWRHAMYTALGKSIKKKGPGA